MARCPPAYVCAVSLRSRWACSILATEHTLKMAATFMVSAEVRPRKMNSERLRFTASNAPPSTAKPASLNRVGSEANSDFRISFTSNISAGMTITYAHPA
eukprot:1722597-Rhodomonas_salina.2